MNLPLSLRNLFDEPLRLIVALTGVAFATTLILMQIGFLGAVRTSAVQVYDRIEFDLLMRSPRYTVLSSPGTILARRLTLAESVPGVARVAPLSIGFTTWRNPETHLRRPILVLGVDPDDSPLAGHDFASQIALLRRPGTVLVDSKSHRAFGVSATPQLFAELRPPGYEVEAGGTSVRVAGYFTMGTGFSADGAIVTSRETFNRICAASPDRVSFGLVTLDETADPAVVAAQLASIQPPDVAVALRRDVLAAERWHWTWSEALGVIFLMGLGVSIVVGVAVVYQLLSAEISGRFAEYATLKAMGYPPRYLTNLILQQSAILAVLAFPLACGGAALLDWVARVSQNVPVTMVWWRPAAGFLLSLSMCIASGMLSIRKVKVADPAELF